MSVELIQAEQDSGRQPRLATWHYRVMELWAEGSFLADLPADADKQTRQALINQIELDAVKG